MGTADSGHSRAGRGCAGWVADFSRALSYTYGAGVPILQALELGAQGRSRLLNAAMRNARTQMQAGASSMLQPLVLLMVGLMLEVLDSLYS